MTNNINERLIQLLGKDASRSSDSLARELRVSSASVRRKIYKLSKEGTLRIVAVVDPEKVGLHVGALLSLEVPQEKLEEVCTGLCRLPEVKWVSTMTGKNNLIVYVRASSNNGISEFLNKELPKLDGVRSCETTLCLNVIKGCYVTL